MSGGTTLTEVSTDATGNYAVSFAPGSYTLVVQAQGLAPNYSTVTFAAGVTDQNVALSPEAEVTGLVSLSDDQPLQSVYAIGVLQGNESLPYFTGTSGSANFVLDSLAPGVYDISILVPNYIPVTINNLQVGAGQTVDLGLIQLTPVDPFISPDFLSLKSFLQSQAEALVAKSAANQQTPVSQEVMQILQDYFSGIGVAKVNPTPIIDSTHESIDFAYTTSLVANPLVTIDDQSDLAAFANDSQTQQALKMTLQQIASGLQANPGADKDVQDAIDALKNAGCDASPQTVPLAVQKIMPELGLGNWMEVTQDPGSPYGPSPDPVLLMWRYQNSGILSAIAGGVGTGGAPPANAGLITYDNRILSGNLTLTISPNGSATLQGSFNVNINDTFDFADNAGLGPLFDNGTVKGGLNLGQFAIRAKDGSVSSINYANLINAVAVAGGVVALGTLEKLDLTCDVPFTTKFSVPNLPPAPLQFTTNMPDCGTPPVTPLEKPARINGTVVQSHDPNALIGPAGFGMQAFIRDNAVLPYTIDFENDGGAAAQDVTVTEQLSSNLDWSTFPAWCLRLGFRERPRSRKLNSLSNQHQLPEL